MYYLNAAVDDGSAIANLMKYFKTADANDNSQGNLSKRINTIKTQKEGSTFMDELLKEALNIGKAEGLTEGKNQEKIATAKRMLKKGKSSLEDIAEDTDLSLDVVKHLQAEMLQPV